MKQLYLLLPVIFHLYSPHTKTPATPPESNQSGGKFTILSRRQCVNHEEDQCYVIRAISTHTHTHTLICSMIFTEQNNKPFLLLLIQKLEELDRRSLHQLETLEREQRHLQRQLSQLQTHGDRERVCTDSQGSHVDSGSDRGQCPESELSAKGKTVQHHVH